MAQNKKHISPENITEWLSSTGFLFPRNEVELGRFEKLYNDVDFGLTGKEIDPEKIVGNNIKDKKNFKILDGNSQFRMAARNGKALSNHIMDKILKNQKKPKNDSPSEEDTYM